MVSWIALLLSAHLELTPRIYKTAIYSHGSLLVVLDYSCRRWFLHTYNFFGFNFPHRF